MRILVNAIIYMVIKSWIRGKQAYAGLPTVFCTITFFVYFYIFADGMRIRRLIFALSLLFGAAFQGSAKSGADMRFRHCQPVVSGFRADRLSRKEDNGHPDR